MFPHARSRLNETGEASFKAQLYWSMIAQALAMKQNIESTRGLNRFGTLVWQLNEIVSPCPASTRSPPSHVLLLF